jgi:hypothetical protein
LIITAYQDLNRSEYLKQMNHTVPRRPRPRPRRAKLTANSGAGLKDLMARMGHDSERAALIYQHEARGADKRITDAIDSHVQAERDRGDDDDGSAGVLVPVG